MTRAVGSFFTGAAAVCAVVANAAPPAPVVEPAELAQPIGGYDLRAPYQLWRGWIESRKGEVVQDLVAQPDQIAGERPAGPDILGWTLTNDFGRFAAGDIRRYCPVIDAHRVDGSNCHYLYRVAYVPHEAGAYGELNPLSRWMRESFDAELLAAHLRASGFSPDTDWWSADRARMFSALPSPVPMLRENAVVERWDSRDCPQLAAAIGEMETRRIDWPVDIFGVGEDRLQAPLPHAVAADYRLTLIVPGYGGIVTLSGAGDTFHELTRPISAAVQACRRRQREAASAAN